MPYAVGARGHCSNSNSNSRTSDANSQTCDRIISTLQILDAAPQTFSPASDPTVNLGADVISTGSTQWQKKLQYNDSFTGSSASCESSQSALLIENDTEETGNAPYGSPATDTQLDLSVSPYQLDIPSGPNRFLKRKPLADSLHTNDTPLNISRVPTLRLSGNLDDASQDSYPHSPHSVLVDSAFDSLKHQNVAFGYHVLEPPLKRRKFSASLSRTISKSTFASAANIKPLQYAQEPASLRRAKSLRSEAPFSPEDNKENLNSAYSNIDTCVTPHPQSPDSFLPPTEPSSPVLELQIAISHVPIIAPPAFHEIPRAPLSFEDAAEARLEILLTKEWHQRIADGLNPVANTEDAQSICESSSFPLNLNLNRLYKPEPVQGAFGIESDFRRKVVEWILSVCPPRPTDGTYNDLYDQLSTSAETRFIAAYLFSRFFFLSDTEGPEGQGEGFTEYTWDIAVACIALSVKMIRDFLWPLNPVVVEDFIHLAPHDMSYEDFEVAQKDVLEAFSYCLQGNTPQPFVEELWTCLPALRKLVGLEKRQKDALMERVWVRLYDCLLQPTIIFTPISLIVACILVDAVIEHVAVRYQIYAYCSELKSKLTSVMKDFMEDMQDVMGISIHDIQIGRKWLETVDLVFSVVHRG